MSTILKNSIRELLKESSQFNINDVLVHVDEGNSKLFFFTGNISPEINEFPKSIIRDADKTIKEAGVNSLCKAEGIIHLQLNGRDIKTPILLSPLNYTIDKVNNKIIFEAVVEERFVNPFLKQHLIHTLNLKGESKEDFFGMEESAIELSALEGQLKEFGLEIEESNNCIVGNFHHHRFQIIKELEELLEIENPSSNIHSLFGAESDAENVILHLSDDNLFPSDIDHERVFVESDKSNLVIQGPPGTGKSQVLSNILGKILGTKHTTIVVSEKRVALEVLKNKLASFKLDKLCFISTSDNLSHSFLQELKVTWDYFESYKSKPINNLRLSEQYEASLQMTLDLLLQPNLIGGVSFHQFQELAENKKIENYPYSSDVPDINLLVSNQSTFVKIYAQELNSLIGFLKYSTLSNEKFAQFDSKIEGWISSINKLNVVFNFNTWSDFDKIMKEAANCQIYENDLYKRYTSIFSPNSKDQKRFLQLRKHYFKARLEIEKIGSEQSEWKLTPTEAETNSLLNILEGKSSFFSKLKIRRRWKVISELPFSEAEYLLNEHIKKIHKINAFSQIIINFCELGIENAEIEVPLIYQTLTTFTEEQWNALGEISPSNRQLITANHGEINNLFHDLKSYFNFQNETKILPYLNELKLKFSMIMALKSELVLLDEKCLLTLSKNCSFQSFEGQILHSHWVVFKDCFPMYSEFSMSQIVGRIDLIIKSQEEEARLYANEIENGLSKTFVSYHDILNTPSRKLNDEKKKLKARLRKGKSILIKEFSKSRSHPSLRELFNSEARIWIQLLKPIWLSNPTQLAKCFPLEENLFDVAIFDESSQIPLQNALGAIQRSSRIIIAGDENQMGPSSYFKTGTSEPMDVLHQANYYWKRVGLEHHYRSVHPDLIEFSNAHFYRGLLKTYPANSKETPIRHHYISAGTFVNRSNLYEARAIAESVEQRLDSKDSIGVVAFSEEQLTIIWNELTENGRKKLTEKIENRLGFFKALENVQGDECDHLYISFGYGPNEGGEFHMRFGPMNTSNGRKRLNVLLTRAIKSIDFFCSVRSVDFSLSENESINLLKKWIAYSESYEPNKELTFPFGLMPIRENDTLTFYKIQEKLSLAKEVVTMTRVMRDRGWHVKFA